MTEKASKTDARERVLKAAEQLFAQKGYAAVTLRDIATAVGIRHASLYHHVPGGKEALFVEVTERTLARHRAGLEHATATAAPDVRSQLCAVADWLLSQPPMDLVRMTHSDMPSIDPAHAARLSQAAFEALLRPVEFVLRRAAQNGEIDHAEPGLIAGGLVGMIESLHAIPDEVVQESRAAMAHVLIDAFLTGLRPRA